MLRFTCSYVSEQFFAKCFVQVDGSVNQPMSINSQAARDFPKMF